MKSPVIRVVAGLVRHERLLLACQRSRTASFPLKWEFPGGKLEAGETWTEALTRELREELAIEVQAARQVVRYVHKYPEMPAVELAFFTVDRYAGEITNRVFEQIRWLTVEELAGMDFLEGDRPLIKRLMRTDVADLFC